MKIGFIGSVGIPARYGGTETQVEEVSTRLVERGHSVSVYSVPYKKKFSRYKGVEIIQQTRFRNKFLDFFLRKLLSSFHAMVQDYDIVHYFASDSWFYSIFPKIVGKKVLIQLDGLDWQKKSYPIIVRFLLRWFTPLIFKIADYIVIDSLPVYRFYKKWFGGDNFCFIPYGTFFPNNVNEETLKKYKLHKNSYNLFIGRFVEEKGIEILLEAYKMLKNPLPLVIVGDNPYNSSYENYLKSIAGDNVYFLGAIYGSELTDLLVGAYSYVSATTQEGTSPVMLMAMGAKKCIITSNIPMNKHVLQKSGILFESESIEDLAKKIDYIESHPEVVKDMGIAAHYLAKTKYSWEKITLDYENIYQNML